MAERDQKAIIQRLTEQMDKDNLDALILTSGDAVFYATGYASRDLYKNGQTGGTVAVVTKDGRAGVVDSEFARRTAGNGRGWCGDHLLSHMDLYRRLCH